MVWVPGHVGQEGGEVEAKGAVQLALDEARGDDAAAEVDGAVWEGELVVEGGLAAQDGARGGADPDIVPHERVATQDAAVGQLGDAILGGRSRAVN